MSVTINTEPATVQPLENVVWGATLSDGGTPPVIRSMGFLLKGPGGANLTKIGQIKYTGLQEYFDFTELIASHLKTAEPDISSRSIVQESNFAKQFTLQVGDIDFNSDTCNTQITLTTNSNAITVINSRVSPWENSGRYDTGVIPLSYRPSVTYAHRNQVDFIHAFRASGAVYYSLKVNFQDGTSADYSGNTTLTNNAVRIPIGPANLWAGPFAKEIRSYKIGLREQSVAFPAAEYTIFVDQDNCLVDDSQQPITEFFGVEPLGGISSVKIDSVTAQTSLSSVQYKQAKTPGTAKAATSGGLTKVDNQGAQVFSLSGTMTYSPGLDNWLGGLFSSKDTWVKYTDFYGTRLVKCVVVDGQYQTFSGKETQYSVTVQLHYNQHR